MFCMCMKRLSGFFCKKKAVISVLTQCLTIMVTGFLHSELQTKLFQYQNVSELHFGAVKYIFGRRENVCSVMLL